MGFYKQVVIVPDAKTTSGVWEKSFPIGEGVYATTRAYSCWSRIGQRCLQGSSTQRRAKSFEGNENKFKDFQEFAEWCQTQPGYNNKDDNGKYWQLDKDIIKPFNKEYSKENCCFVPHRVNSLLLFKSASRGNLPLGVFLDKRRDDYIARCRGIDSKVKWLGSFTNPLLAHRAWQLSKINVIKLIAEEFKPTNISVYHGLLTHSDYIQQDYDNNRETLR